jgi:F-type H+-transporting ATPase subunit epsilon
MAAETLHLEITTPEKVLFSDEVTNLEAPGADGEFQILPGHTPFLTGLNIGHLVFSHNDELVRVSVSGGFCEFKNNKAVVIAHTAEQREDIDVARAEEARKRAQGRIDNASDPDIDIDRAKLALLRAINRINLTEMK